ncbi:MAG: thioredoxin domain-containing protein [Rhizobiales bacterium]|nr:thioredoxin domain-containing protein [Hyphomicrobiales bacterium]
MTSRLYAFALAATAAIALGATGPAAAQSFTPQQRSEIEAIIKDYLIKNPEILKDVASALERQQAETAAATGRKAIKEHATLLFNSPRQVVIGNPRGDVTMVEFFDYNCGFCKRALADMMELIKNDPKLKVVLKEFPVLGEGSVQAAQVAAAAMLQDKTGKKYLEFHRKLLTSRGQIARAQAIAAAKETGFDVARIERDSTGPEVRKTLEESFMLAEALGLNGTPSYVIGSNVVIGAVGLAKLKENISQARCGKATC